MKKILILSACLSTSVFAHKIEDENYKGMSDDERQTEMAANNYCKETSFDLH